MRWARSATTSGSFMAHASLDTFGFVSGPTPMQPGSRMTCSPRCAVKRTRRAFDHPREEVVMNANRFLRRASSAGLMAVVLSLAACTSPGGNKAGGSSEPIVLRMAVESSKLDFTPQIRALIERVEELSDGGLRIDETYGVGNWQPHAEQQIVQQVAGGG